MRAFVECSLAIALGVASGWIFSGIRSIDTDDETRGGVVEQTARFTDLPNEDVNEKPVAAYPENLTAASFLADVLARRPSVERDQEIERLFARLGERRPMEGLVALESMTLRDRSIAFAALVTSWTRRDPQGAFSWLAANEGQFRGNLELFRSLALGFEGKSPDLLLSLSAQLSNASRANLLKEYVEHAANASDLAALSLRFAEFDEYTTSVNLAPFAQAWGGYDLESASQWLASNGALSDAEVETAFLATVVGASSTNPEMAMQWLLDLPEDVANKAIPSSAKEWILNDGLENFVDWLANVEDEVGRDRVITSSIGVVARRSSEKAMILANLSDSPGVRTTAIAHYAVDNRDGAVDWLLQQRGKADYAGLVSTLTFKDLELHEPWVGLNNLNLVDTPEDRRVVIRAIRSAAMARSSSLTAEDVALSELLTLEERASLVDFIQQRDSRRGQRN